MTPPVESLVEVEDLFGHAVVPGGEHFPENGALELDPTHKTL